MNQLQRNPPAPGQGCTLAADFGGTTIKIGIACKGELVAETALEALASRSMHERLEAVACAWEGLLAANSLALPDCLGVGLSLPFLKDPQHPRVLGEFGKFPGAVEIDFEHWGRARLGLPVALENDLRVALLGEWAAGAGRGRNEIVMLSLGTGIGCACLVNGRLFRGANNRAATLLGHSTVGMEGMGEMEQRVGRCGNIGCAEDLASTATLPTLAKGRGDYAQSALARAERIDYKTVFKLARAGDACSQGLLNQSLKVWSVVVQNAVLAFDPELVILGGGVLRDKELIIPAIEKHLRAHMPGLPSFTPILPSALGDGAALLGCEVLLHQSFGPDFQ